MLTYAHNRANITCQYKVITCLNGKGAIIYENTHLDR